MLPSDAPGAATCRELHISSTSDMRWGSFNQGLWCCKMSDCRLLGVKVLKLCRCKPSGFTGKGLAVTPLVTSRRCSCRTKPICPIIHRLSPSLCRPLSHRFRPAIDSLDSSRRTLSLLRFLARSLLSWPSSQVLSEALRTQCTLQKLSIDHGSCQTGHSDGADTRLV